MKLNPKLVKEILELQYPIGKTELFFDNNDHSNYMGFTWQLEAKGKAIVGIDTNDTDFNTIGKTGGEKTHTLTIQEMPKHSHKVYYTDDGGQGSIARINVMGNQTSTTEVGGGQAHNNVQPYEVFAIWVRTA